MEILEKVFGYIAIVGLIIFVWLANFALIFYIKTCFWT